MFFRDFNVPDTLDGRFDVLVFHAWLVLRELQRREERELAQVLVDQLFARLEEALRELGAGDIGLGRRMKAMTSAFYGRLEAYESAADVPALGTAIGRNLYRHADCDLETALSLARYAASAGAHLAQCRLEQGDVDFGALPALVAAQDTQAMRQLSGPTAPLFSGWPNGPASMRWRDSRRASSCAHVPGPDSPTRPISRPRSCKAAW